MTSKESGDGEVEKKKEDVLDRFVTYVSATYRNDKSIKLLWWDKGQEGLTGDDLTARIEMPDYYSFVFWYFVASSVRVNRDGPFSSSLTEHYKSYK